MTDNEIIKALECCKYNNCHECPIKGCTDNIFGEALDLINRQREENKQWKEEANKYQNLWCDAVNDIETAKSEAIQEFAERLKEYRNDCPMNGKEYICMDIQEIDNLVKKK